MLYLFSPYQRFSNIFPLFFLFSFYHLLSTFFFFLIYIFYIYFYFFYSIICFLLFIFLNIFLPFILCFLTSIIQFHSAVFYFLPLFSVFFFYLTCLMRTLQAILPECLRASYPFNVFHIDWTDGKNSNGWWWPSLLDARDANEKLIKL